MGVVMSVTRDEQAARLKGAPPIVLWLVLDAGCWVVGSRASFRDVRIHEKSDWDILVPFASWGKVVGTLPLNAPGGDPAVVATRRGGWRFWYHQGRVDGVILDGFPGDVGEWLSRPFVHVAWHPSTGTVVERTDQQDHPRSPTGAG